MNKEIIKMRELPETMRPYEKCLSCGPQALSDAELLAVILRNGTTKDSALHIALKLLGSFNSSHTLADITSASVEELSEIDGIGNVKAITLKCVGELSSRISREKAQNNLKLTDASSIAAYYMERMRHLKHEEIWLALFDTRKKLIRDVFISKGTVNASLISPREVFIHALSHKAVYFVLIHNHPSGDPSPSNEDKELTDKLNEIGKILSLPFVDHIIIGDNKYFSMKEKGIL